MPPNRTSESARIAARHRAGSVGAILGWGPTTGRRGAKQRDFQRENVKQLRDLQKRVRQQQEEKGTPAPHETFRLSQFDNIPSRLHRPHLRSTLSSINDSDGYRDQPAVAPRSGFSTIVFTPPPRSAAAVHGRVAPGEEGVGGQRTSTGSSARLSTSSSAGGATPGGLISTPSPPQGPRSRASGPRRSGSDWNMRGHSTPAKVGRRGALRTSPPSGCSVSFEDDEREDEEEQHWSCGAADNWDRPEVEEEDWGGSSVAALEQSWAQLRRQQLQRPSRGHAARGYGQDVVPSNASRANGRPGSPSRRATNGRPSNQSRPPSSTSSNAATAGGTAAWWPVRAACDGDYEGRGGREEGEEEGEEEGRSVPMGYRLVPEDQRLECLAELKSKLTALNEKYARLPLRIETEGYRLLQEKLRSQISETEKAVQLFSRPKGVLMEI